MKKILKSFILWSLIFTTNFAAEAFAASDSHNPEKIKVIVNGKEIKFDQIPVLKNDRVFIPIRAVAEELGGIVLYFGNSEKKDTAEVVIGLPQLKKDCYIYFKESKVSVWDRDGGYVEEYTRAGVVFDIKRADGQRVQGDIADKNQPGTVANSPNKTTTLNGDISGSYSTDKNGRILINNIPFGEYHVVETKALPGYEIDKNVHSVTVVPGKLATLQLQNKPMGGLRIKKIDAVSKRGIFNVEFRIYDFETNKEVAGAFYTDNEGIIDLTGILPAGKYKIIETRPAEGYLRDDIPKTIEFKEGQITEILWENHPYLGQIQIIKKSADDNQINGLPKGTVLANATFEVYNYKTGNVVDQFTTGDDGRGVSKPLPIGRYLIKETIPPKYYKKADHVLDVEIEFPKQILKYEVTNESANTGVSIKKTGVAETMPNQQIKYDFKVIQNNSTVPLTDFFWRECIPTNAVRINKLITGTYNQDLRYKVMFRTNKNDYRVMADNLLTSQNNVIDCSNASLGLYSDEYVTEIMVVFGNVKAGFTQVQPASVLCTVNSNLVNIVEFANKADIGGKYYGEWIISNTTWVTKVYNPTKTQKIPKTGY